MLEKRRKQIIELIAKEAIDARTNTPIPPQRRELAMEQAKVHIDPFKRAEDQIEGVVKALRPILPIKMEKVKVAVKVPSQFAMSAYQMLRSYKVVNEEWTSSGDVIVVVEIPAGLQAELYERLGKLTHGQAQTKILR